MRFIIANKTMVWHGMSELFDLQKAFTEHLRNPDQVPVPTGLDPRRVGIYSGLIFNNLSALLADFFPVIKTILDEDRWHHLVRDFFITHQAKTPYFTKVSEEFVHYLSGRQNIDADPAFLLELAHYEWIELYLYMHEGNPPEVAVADSDLLISPLSLSSIAQPLAYEYPVHLIREDYQPDEPGEQGTFLLVFRDRDESVRFFELQPFTYRLLEAINENPGLVAGDWLRDVAEQLVLSDSTAFINSGLDMLKQFNQEYVFISVS